MPEGRVPRVDSSPEQRILDFPAGKNSGREPEKVERQAYGAERIRKNSLSADSRDSQQAKEERPPPRLEVELILYLFVVSVGTCWSEETGSGNKREFNLKFTRYILWSCAFLSWNG